MKKDDIITIYESWRTQEKPEGQAKLVKKIMEGDDYEYWKVHFVNDERIYVNDINP